MAVSQIEIYDNTTVPEVIEVGIAGAQGPKGDTGDVGPEGPKGDTGDVGPAAASNQPYYNLVGEPPAIYTPEWIDWAERLLSVRLGNVPSARTTTYYFSQSGDDDTGDGTIDLPWKSLAKAQAVHDDSDGDICLRFNGGDVWRQSTPLLITKNHCTVSNYGTGSPLFSRFDVQYTTGWTAESETLYSRADTNTPGWVREGADTAYPFNHIYIRKSSSADVEATTYSFYHSGTVLYVNCGADPNTLDGGLEMAGFGGGWLISGDNVRFENINVHGYGMNTPAGGSNYGIQIASSLNGEVVFDNVEFLYTGYHSFGNGGVYPNILTYVNCRAGLCTNDFGGNSTSWVAYANTGGMETIYWRCENRYGALPDYSWTSASSGVSGYVFFVHSGDGLPARLQLLAYNSYPSSSWQNQAYQIGAAPASRVEDVRAFVYGEESTSGMQTTNAAFNVAMANCSFDFGPWIGPAGSDVAQFNGPYQIWAFNCTFKKDASTAYNYGTGYSWFYGNGSACDGVFENCRFDMVRPASDGTSIFQLTGTDIGSDMLLRNCIFSFTGSVSQPLAVGQAAADSTVFKNCAYYAQSGTLTTIVANDSAGVLLTSAPVAGVMPYPSHGLYDGGAVNKLLYDRYGSARSTERFDIGPVVGAAISGVALLGSSNTFTVGQSVTGTMTATTFSGSGASLTALPAGQLTGSVDDARLSNNVVLKNADNILTGNLSLGSSATNWFWYFIGSNYDTGVKVNPAGISNLNGSGWFSGWGNGTSRASGSANLCLCTPDNIAYSSFTSRLTMNLDGRIGVGAAFASPSSLFHVKGSDAALQVFIVQGASAQSVNLQEWQNSGNTVLCSITSDGSIRTAGTLSIASDNMIVDSAGRVAAGSVYTTAYQVSAESASSSGSQVYRFQVYDSDGNSIGFVPVFDS